MDVVVVNVRTAGVVMHSKSRFDYGCAAAHGFLYFPSVDSSPVLPLAGDVI